MPVGQITVTFQRPIPDDGTCATNFLCNGTWHDGYFYALGGGTITVGTATAYQGQAPFRDENGFAPILGFSVGVITGGTGKYKDISGRFQCGGTRTFAFVFSTSLSHS